MAELLVPLQSVRGFFDVTVPSTAMESLVRKLLFSVQSCVFCAFNVTFYVRRIQIHGDPNQHTLNLLVSFVLVQLIAISISVWQLIHNFESQRKQYMKSVMCDVCLESSAVCISLLRYCFAHVEALKLHEVGARDAGSECVTCNSDVDQHQVAFICKNRCSAMCIRCAGDKRVEWWKCVARTCKN